MSTGTSEWPSIDTDEARRFEEDFCRRLQENQMRAAEESRQARWGSKPLKLLTLALVPSVTTIGWGYMLRDAHITIGERTIKSAQGHIDSLETEKRDMNNGEDSVRIVPVEAYNHHTLPYKSMLPKTTYTDLKRPYQENIQASEQNNPLDAADMVGSLFIGAVALGLTKLALVTSNTVEKFYDNMGGKLYRLTHAKPASQPTDNLNL